jgi:hypothetical protein
VSRDLPCGPGIPYIRRVKSFKTKPRHDLAEPALWCAGIGLLCLSLIAFSPGSWFFTLPLGLIYLSIAAGVWQERRGAVIAGAVLFSIGVIGRIQRKLRRNPGRRRKSR